MDDDEELLHRRQIEVRACRRRDGTYRLDATVTDIQNRPFDNGWRAPVPPGDPIHDMTLSVVVSGDLTILSIAATSRAHPYPGECGVAALAYRALEGLTLGPGFRQALRERLGAAGGCVHLSELFGPLATVAYIATTLDLEKDGTADAPPRFLGGCHALRTDGPVVARDYPAFATPARTSAKDGNG